MIAFLLGWSRPPFETAALCRSLAVWLFVATVSVAQTPESASSDEDPEAEAIRAAIPHVLDVVGEELDEAARDLITRAKSHAAVEEWDQAEALFRRVHERYPAEGYVQFALGTALIETRKHREAAELLAPLVHRFPNHPSLLNNLAWLYGKSEDEGVKNLDRAIEYVQGALVAAPDSPLIWSTAAEIYYRKGNFRRALSMSGIAVELARSMRISNLSDFIELRERCARAVRALEILE